MILLRDHLFGQMLEKNDKLPYDIAIFYNREHLEPPLNYEEFSQVAYEAEMRTNYLAALEGRCSCCLYRNDQAFKKLAEEVANSDEMKQVKLLVYANIAFEKLKSEPFCAHHAVDQIKPMMLDYNNRHDKLSAGRVEFVFDFAYSRCDGFEYVHKNDGIECKGYKHRLVWEPDSIVDEMR